MNRLTELRLLKRAARESMRRRSSPGTDRQTWNDYREKFSENLIRLADQLSANEWVPSQPIEKEITSITGKQFSIFIPTVEERIVHRAIRNIVEPILDIEALQDFVSGFRKGRNRMTALRQASLHLRELEPCHVFDADVKQVSASATPEDVAIWLSRWISDSNFLSLVKKALGVFPTAMAPGSGLAPLLINLRLSRADEQLPPCPVVRFCDNYCFFGNLSEVSLMAEELRSALSAIGLSINERKSSFRIAPNPEDLFLIDG